MIRSAFRVFLLLTLLFCLGTCFKIQPRIINGFPSERGQFPFHAYLITKLRYEPKYRYICGGTILNRNFILTAAHCLNNANKIEIHLGSWKQDKREKGRQVFFARLKHLFLHPDFDAEHLSNDIGLIKLPKPAIFTKLVQPVQFPNVCDIFEGMDLIAIGNGYKANREHADTLQLVKLVTTTVAECKEIYSDIDENKTFCAKGSRNESICQGDSGGALVHPIKHTLFGISSFTNDTDCDGTPQGFTNVFPYIPWISAITDIQFPFCN